MEVFAEKVSSRAPLEKRHQLRACLETLQEGDELVISKLDRLGRSQVEVINRLADLQEKGIHIFIEIFAVFALSNLRRLLGEKSPWSPEISSLIQMLIL